MQFKFNPLTNQLDLVGSGGSTSLTLTTTGTSGAATLTGTVLNIPVYSSGGSTSPGGLNTQLQYNNNGVFGGITGAVTDGTAVSLTAAHLLNPTINGAGTGLATLAYPNTSSSATITLPTVTGTLATLAGTETFTNKTLTAPTITGATITTSTVNGVTLTTGGSSTTFLNGAGTYTTPAGAGTVTTVSVVSANGFAGTVATATSTPAITLTTSITGVLKGNGTAISAATLGTDYSGGTSALTTGILKSTTTTGALTIAVAADFPTLNQNTTGSAATLTTARTIGIATGDATSAGSTFDGSANNTNALTLATVNTNVGSFTNANITVNGKGLITAASNGSASGITIGTTTITSGTTTRVLFDNAGVVGEYSISGTGNVAMTTTPTFTSNIIIGTTADFTGSVSGTTKIVGASSGGGTLTLPAGTDTLVSLTASQTLTNKTLTSPTLTTPVINGIPTGTGVATAATASTLVLRDANANNSANNYLQGYTTTATAGGTTTLTVGSTYLQYFTGTTTAQTITLPVTSTLVLGQSFLIVNNTTSAVLTIQSSGGSTIYLLTGNGTASSRTALLLTCINTAGTTTTSWSWTPINVFAASGKTGLFNNSLTLNGTDATTMTFPSTSATIARTDAANTFTGVQTFSSAPVLSTGTLTNTGTVTFFTSSDTVVGRATTDTLTNKRITRRLTTTNAPGASPSTNTNNVDIQSFTGIATAITSMTTNLSGAANDGDLLEFRFLDAGTAETIGWGTSFAATTVALPTTTVISTTLRVLFEWRTASSKWECLAVA